MSYTKPDQSQFAGNVNPGEFVVQLDTGEFVALRVVTSVEPNTGNSVVDAWAFAIEADGSTHRNAVGDPVSSTFQANADAAMVEALGGIDELRRKALLTVLGEDAGWINPPHQDVFDHASIRTTLAAAANAGVADNIGDML